MSKAYDGFVVFESILRRGFCPHTITSMGGRIKERDELFNKMVDFGCRPNMITFGILSIILCQIELPIGYLKKCLMGMVCVVSFVT